MENYNGQNINGRSKEFGLKKDLYYLFQSLIPSFGTDQKDYEIPKNIKILIINIQNILNRYKWGYIQDSENIQTFLKKVLLINHDFDRGELN